MATTPLDARHCDAAESTKEEHRPEDEARRPPPVAAGERTVGPGDVDALFLSDDSGRRLITLNGADRAYRLLLEGMADGALTITPDGLVAWCNRSFADLLGRPLNRLIGTRIERCFAPEGHTQLATLLAAGRSAQLSLALDLLNDLGSRVPVYVSVNPSVVDGLPEALCMVVTDLTEQRRSESDRLSRQQLLTVIEDQRRTQAQLQESMAALCLRNRALGAVSQGVLITDAQQRVTYANSAFEVMSGYCEAEMLGRTCGLLQGPLSAAAAVEAMHRALAAALPFHGEILNYRKDGEPFWNDLSITPVFDAAGGLTQFVGVQRDITARKQADEARNSLGAQLREAQKMEAVGTLAGGIAHDFNNILGSMLGNLGLARHVLGTEHEANALLEQAQVAGGRARTLVEQILAFSRRQPTLLKAQLLEPIVRVSMNLLRATLPATVRLELVVATTPQPMILGDTTQLEQIVINLCTNAWQALAPSSGRITLNIDAVRVDAGPANTLPPGNYAHLRVTDNGHGMDVATQARIFEPFFSTKPPGLGTGLGLAVVHGIVASHGGYIAVRSSPGAGTIFDLHFPATAADPEAAAVPVSLEAGRSGQGQRVMYIDDDEVMSLMVGHLLDRLGYRATCFTDPALALAAVQANPAAVDAVVTDYNMPLMTGLEFTRALRACAPELPVAISSGFISDELKASAAKLGVLELMRKEHTLEELGALLCRLLMQPLPCAASLQGVGQPPPVAGPA